MALEMSFEDNGNNRRVLKRNFWMFRSELMKILCLFIVFNLLFWRLSKFCDLFCVLRRRFGFIFISLLPGKVLWLRMWVNAKWLLDELRWMNFYTVTSSLKAFRTHRSHQHSSESFSFWKNLEKSQNFVSGLESIGGNERRVVVAWGVS